MSRGIGVLEANGEASGEPHRRPARRAGAPPIAGGAERLTVLMPHVTLIFLRRPGSLRCSFMDKTVHQLGELLLTALPTFLLLIFLTYYLKVVFFKPMEDVLRRRYEATEGARKLAEQSLERAAAKTAEYEATLRKARGEIYQAQEQAYREMQERAAGQIAEARTRADEAIREARRQLAEDVEAAKASLANESNALANQIAESLLGRRAA